MQVTATDIDSGVNGKVGYTLERGDRHQQFSMDPNTGHITIARPLDREMVCAYNITLHSVANTCASFANMFTFSNHHFTITIDFIFVKAVNLIRDSQIKRLF